MNIARFEEGYKDDDGDESDSYEDKHLIDQA